MRNSIAVIAFIAAVIAFPPQASAEESAPRADKPPTTEAQALLGRWVRTDYPYTIEITSLKEDGTMEAAYYNPKPINVGNAKYEESVAGLVATVELRDVNYPGSTYILTYDSARGALIGTYFQAVEGTTFGVAFVRQP